MGNELKLQNLVIMLNTRCVPYCCWEAEDAGNGEAHAIAPELLRSGIEFAARQHLALTFVEGEEAPGPELEALMQPVAHTRIVPFARRGGMSRERIVVMDAADLPAAAAEPELFLPHAIVRLGADSVRALSAVLGGIHGKYGRLNLCPRGLERWSEDDLARYGAELSKFADGLLERINIWWHPEINVLTDRMMLRGMNNCDAGLRQMTLAPNGRFYPCPAFYITDPENPAGDPDQGIKLKNGHLLCLEYAPLCRRCDAFHCRRCVYLNRRLTGEINTPSRQQCLGAHEEREAARQMLGRMLEAGMIRDPHACSPIPPLDFRDPLDGFNRENPGAPIGPAAPASADTEAMLREILAVQREILEQIKMINQKLQRGTENP